MLADGGDCLADLGAVRDQDALFGAVASDSTAFRVVDRIASTPGLLDALADAHARAREHVWKLTGAPERVTIEVDATLVGSYSEKEGAAGTYKESGKNRGRLAYSARRGAHSRVVRAAGGPRRPVRTWFSVAGALGRGQRSPWLRVEGRFGVDRQASEAGVAALGHEDRELDA